MKFCSRCGAAGERRIPPGDDRPRFVCPACGTIHYENPRVIAGCIPEWEGRILLCRRAIDPARGMWTLPAGFMEGGETTEEAAIRETREETGADVEIGMLYSVFSIPHLSQVYIMFRARMRSPRVDPGAETLEVALAGRDEIPWDRLAFPVIRTILERYLRERDAGHFGIYVGGLEAGTVLPTLERPEVLPSPAKGPVRHGA